MMETYSIVPQHVEYTIAHTLSSILMEVIDYEIGDAFCLSSPHPWCTDDWLVWLVAPLVKVGVITRIVLTIKG